MTEAPLTLIFLGAGCWILGRVAPLIRAGKIRPPHSAEGAAGVPPMPATERMPLQAQPHGAENRAAAGL